MSKLTHIAGCAVALLVAVLLLDYAVATRRASADDKLVKELQQQAKADAAASPKEQAEEKRITASHLARKKRDQVASWLLIATAALFVFSSGKLVGRREPPAVAVADRKKQPARPLKPPSPLLKGPLRALLRYRITDACIGCTVCAQVCPKDAIEARPYEKHVVDETLCKPCDLCRRVCQEDAVELIEPIPEAAPGAGTGVALQETL